MPFRVSFYEHFGYGLVEQRDNWTVPISILPAGEFEGIGIMSENQLPLYAEAVPAWTRSTASATCSAGAASWELRKVPIMRGSSPAMGWK